MTRPIKPRIVRRIAGAAGGAPAARSSQLASPVCLQIDDIYYQMDDLLTRLAQIQLQFDRLRSTIRLL